MADRDAKGRFLPGCNNPAAGLKHGLHAKRDPAEIPRYVTLQSGAPSLADVLVDTIPLQVGIVEAIMGSELVLVASLDVVSSYSNLIRICTRAADRIRGGEVRPAKMAGDEHYHQSATTLIREINRTMFNVKSVAKYFDAIERKIVDETGYVIQPFNSHLRDALGVLKNLSVDVAAYFAWFDRQDRASEFIGVDPYEHEDADA
jgi:hypothetical protein